MAYCVGNCLSWDEVSGNLTIKEDPLGGLECLPNGQKIRIAGATTGVAVNAKNNGLFMTSAGELATKVTPQCRTYTPVGNGQAINASLTSGVNYNYGNSGNIVVSNPSAVYPMLVIVSCGFFFDYSIQPNTNISSQMETYGYLDINGSAVQITHQKFAFDKLNAASGGKTNITRMDTQNGVYYHNLNPSTSVTFATHCTFIGAGTDAWAWQAYSQVTPFGIIMERI